MIASHPDTVEDVLRGASARLGSTSAAPRRDAELLLMHVLGVTRAALLTHPERVLTPEETAAYAAAIARRARCEPVQYITGWQEFFGLAFAVTPAVLIPRPETEHLVEEAMARVPRMPPAPVRILDAGTGSGAIAVSLAVHLPHAEIMAADISPAALEIARENASRHGAVDRIRFLESDLLAAVRGERFGMIVSNPPYVANAETLEPQVADYEPHAALFAGPTGLEVYQRLIPQAWEALIPGGWLLLEIGQGQREAVGGLLAGWDNISFAGDLQGIPRVAIAQREG